MEQITYKQACELLGVKYVTIKDAVLYGKLTRCAYPEKQAMLLRAQVELFKGKRISPQSLSLEDRQKYEEYKGMAEDVSKLRAALPSSVDVSDKEQSTLIAASQAGREAAAMILRSFVKEMNASCEGIFKDANITLPEMEAAHP